MRSNPEIDCNKAGIENCLVAAEAASVSNEIDENPVMTKKNYIMLR